MLATTVGLKILLQRVTRASVRIEDETVGAIDKGLLLLVGFGNSDNAKVLLPMANKVANLRVFPDEHGRFQYSLLEIGGAVLLVPQFTLYADTRKGRRPDFARSMKPDFATGLFEEFVSAMNSAGVQRIECGRFGADMQVELVNDGPVTILISSESASSG